MKTVPFIAILFQSISLVSQNLVPNYNFEIFSMCPYANGQIDFANNWHSGTSNGTPDYFHRCGVGAFSINNNSTGGIEPFSGDAYAGFYASMQFAGTDVKEYIQAQLLQELDSNTEYYISFHISLSGQSKTGVSSIGILFSKSDSINHNGYLATDTPQIQTNIQEPITDKSWTKHTWIYKANGSEKFITIGNFKSDSASGITNANSGQHLMSYYYIDDVCVSLNPADCNIDTTTTYITNVTKPQFEFKVFPNPARDFIMLTYSSNTNLAYEIINLLGQSVTGVKQLNNNGKEQINTSGINEGIYLLKVYGQDNTIKTVRVIILK